MNRFSAIGSIGAVLAACAGPPAGGQAMPASSGDLARLYPYEVPVEVATQAAPADTGWIHVSGFGSIRVEPDRARVSFAMETRAETAEGASGGNADAMDAVVNALRAGDFVGLELATHGYSLRPEYSVRQNQRTREIVAYTALNDITATLVGVGDVGRLIDTAIGSGANRVASLSFFASDTEAAQAEALAAAVRHARDQARIIAESLGRELGPALEINGGAQRPTPRAYEMAGDVAMARAATTPIEAGDQTVTATVSIRFALGPEIGR